jgi:hypothetical protein
MSRLFIVYRTRIAAEDSPLPRDCYPWEKNAHFRSTAELIYKEAGNVIDWALGHGLKLELDFIYDYMYHNYNIVVFAKNVDPQTKMMLELSKPDPIPSNG